MRSVEHSPEQFRSKKLTRGHLRQADGPFRCSLVKVAKVLQQRIGNYEAVYVDLQEEAVARERQIEVAKERVRLPPE